MEISLMKILFCIVINIVLFEGGYCAAPIIHGLPTSVNVGEREYERRLIYELTVTDVNNNPFTCNTESITPKPNNTNVNFNTLIDSSHGNYVVWMENSNPGTDINPNVMFNYDYETTFDVMIKCNDSQNHASIERLEVDIIDNDRVVFTNLPDTVTLSASTTTANTLVYTVAATNLLTSNDNGLSYSVTSSPASTSFDIDGNGNVNTQQDLIYENNSPITLYVTVTDGIIWVKDSLKISLINMNNIPEITNLKTSPSVHVSELLASGSTIYTLTGYDADATDTLTYSINVDPVADTALFELVTTVDPPVVKLAAGKTFDYETIQYYNVTFTVSDTKATGGPFVLNVHILNENEPCYFDKTLYSVTAYEGLAGSISLNPGFIVRDNDGINLGYSLSLLNGNGSERFTIDATSGIIGYATEYDIDGSAMPSTVYMTVKCQDTTGETGTATILIYILDINDNDPVFQQSEYTFYADQFTGIGSLIGTTTATDADSGSNGQYSCSYGTTQNAIANSFYTVGTDCSVFFSSRSSLSYDTTIRFTLLAVDKGTPSRTGTTYVNAVYRETSTTTQSTTSTTTTSTTSTTTAATPSSGLSDGSIAAIVIGALVGAVLLGILLYMLFRWCFTGLCCGPQPCDFAGCCRRGDYSNYPNRQITPVRSKPALKDRAYDRPRDRDTADEFNYYRDDSDYGSLKNHDIRNSRFSRPDRAYPDWPTTGEAQFPRLSPSDARVEMMSGPYSKGPLAIRY